jgi:hypothetical protein
VVRTEGSATEGSGTEGSGTEGSRAGGSRTERSRRKITERRESGCCIVEESRVAERRTEELHKSTRVQTVEYNTGAWATDSCGRPNGRERYAC